MESQEALERYQTEVDRSYWMLVGWSWACLGLMAFLELAVGLGQGPAFGLAGVLAVSGAIYWWVYVHRRRRHHLGY